LILIDGLQATGSVANTGNILTTQARISTLSTLNLQSIMVANGGATRVQQTTQGPKVIAQPTGRSFFSH